MTIYGKINNELHGYVRRTNNKLLIIYGRIKYFTYVHNKKYITIIDRGQNSAIIKKG